MDIRQFVKRKTFLITEVQKAIQTKDLRSEFCSTSAD